MSLCRPMDTMLHDALSHLAIMAVAAGAPRNQNTPKSWLYYVTISLGGFSTNQQLEYLEVEASRLTPADFKGQRVANERQNRVLWC